MNVGDVTDSLWGVLDLHPVTDFPDIRSKCLIHSLDGTCGTVPREDDMVRMYIQLSEGDIAMSADGKLDTTELTPEGLFEIAQKTFKPYSIAAEKFSWWSVYRSE